MAGNPGMRLLSLSAGASVGAYAMSRTYLTLALLAAVMSTLAVVRHTRQSEETGPRRAPARRGRRALGQPGRGRHRRRSAANVVLAPLLALAMIVNGQPVGGAVRGGCRHGLRWGGLHRVSPP